jgi:hypothetical protein
MAHSNLDWSKLPAEAFSDAILEPYRGPSIFDLIAEPWPHMVHYYTGGKPLYVSPKEFHWRHGPDGPGPSDCTWIVPGTGERR